MAQIPNVLSVCEISYANISSIYFQKINSILLQPPNPLPQVLNFQKTNISPICQEIYNFANGREVLLCDGNNILGNTSMLATLHLIHGRGRVRGARIDNELNNVPGLAAQAGDYIGRNRNYLDALVNLLNGTSMSDIDTSIIAPVIFYYEPTRNQAATNIQIPVIQGTQTLYTYNNYIFNQKGVLLVGIDPLSARTEYDDYMITLSHDILQNVGLKCALLSGDGYNWYPNNMADPAFIRFKMTVACNIQPNPRKTQCMKYATYTVFERSIGYVPLNTLLELIIIDNSAMVTQDTHSCNDIFNSNTGLTPIVYHFGQGLQLDLQMKTDIIDIINKCDTTNIINHTKLVPNNLNECGIINSLPKNIEETITNSIAEYNIQQDNLENEKRNEENRISTIKENEINKINQEITKKQLTIQNSPAPEEAKTRLLANITNQYSQRVSEVNNQYSYNIQQLTNYYTDRIRQLTDIHRQHISYLKNLTKHYPRFITMPHRYTDPASLPALDQHDTNPKMMEKKLRRKGKKPY